MSSDPQPYTFCGTIVTGIPSFTPSALMAIIRAHAEVCRAVEAAATPEQIDATKPDPSPSTTGATSSPLKEKAS